MPETLTLDYRRGGSSGLLLGEAVDEQVTRTTLDRARGLLVGRADSAALALLDALDFRLHHATNSLGDGFIAVHASVSPVAFAEYRSSLSAAGSRLSTTAAALRRAIDDANGGEPEVRFVAISVADTIVRGALGEYRFEEEPFDSGGFATIHRAKTTSGETVALKRLYVRDEEAIGRLRREIQEQQRIQHPAVMRVIDHDVDFRWFIMPLADENLAARWVANRISEPLLLDILRAVAAGLGAAHALNLVHRDVSPRNILRIGKQWTVADWGVVRRPPGMTTMIRTQGELGSLGFAAPELFRTAHAAGPPADVYSLGRIAAWVLTRRWPEQNVALVPEGPWRHFVRRTTEHDATRRSQTMLEVVNLLAEVEAAIRSEPAAEPDATLLTDVECLERCLARPEDADLFLDRLHLVPAGAMQQWVAERSDDVEALVLGMESHLLNSTAWSGRDFNAANSRIAWLRLVATLAMSQSRNGLLEDTTGALLRAEVHWKRFSSRKSTRAWIESLRGEAARTVARVLGREDEAVAWLADEGWSAHRTDASIRAVFDGHALGA